MKKRLWIYPIICLLLGTMVMVFLRAPVSSPKMPQRPDLWVSKRPLPKKIPLAAYLKGNAARQNQDLMPAIQAYIQVLEQDPKNTSLLEETYTLAVIHGTIQPILPFLKEMKSNKLLADYARAIGWFKENDEEKALNLLKQKKHSESDFLLSALVRAWIYAKLDKKQNALAEINSIKKEPFIVGYQKVLLGSYFQDDNLIQKGIEQIGDHSIPAIGYFPLLKNIVSTTGNWEKAALNKKYQEMETTYPATAEILVQVGESELTPEKGMAEAFYLISALAGNGHFTREESLAANSLALLLHPEKQMSLIWGAELAEGLQLPKVALSYYQRLSFRSATLEFKQAASLMQLKKTEEALRKVEKLELTNKTNVPLLTLLGQLYQDTQQREKAIAVYNRLIPLLEKSPKNEPLIQAYVIRGVLYGHDESDKMLQDLKRAYILAPENPMLLNDLGYHQLETGLIDEGFDLVQKAYQKKPEDPYILDSLAFGYWKKGQASAALPLAERALDLMPQSALINAHLGDIYTSLGRLREASFQYKKALDLKTDLTPSLTCELQEKLKEKKS